MSMTQKTKTDHALPRPLKGLLGRSTPAIGYDVTSRTEALSLLAEGYPVTAQGMQGTIRIYRTDSDAIGVQLITTARHGKAAAAAEWIARVPNLHCLDPLLRAWWPVLAI